MRKTPKVLIAVSLVGVMAISCVLALQKQSNYKSFEYKMPLECALAMYAAFKNEDVRFQKDDAEMTLIQYYPLHTDSASCTINDDQILVSVWNSNPQVLGGSSAYTLDKNSFEVVDVLHER